jgi:4-hydroxy-4-methyl-2-oxoglutarate aldolase
MSALIDPAALLVLGTATLSDAMDRLGIEGTCLGISPLSPTFSIAGRARTVRYQPCGIVKGTVGDYVDDYEPGSVAVLDNGGRVDCTVWGDILTEYASRNQIAGTVIDGVCRDSALCRSLDYPVFTRGAFMRTGKDRVQVDELDGPVTIGGVRVHPGDLMIGDADGIVRIPADRQSELFDVASEIDERENAIRAAVRSGARLVDARTQFGYHTLQTRVVTS